MEPEIIAELSAAAEGNFNDLSDLLRRAIAAYRAIATERDHIQRGFNAAVQTVEVRDARINTLEAALHLSELQRKELDATLGKDWPAAAAFRSQRLALETAGKPSVYECPVCRRPLDEDQILGSCANTKDGSHRRMDR